MTGWDDMLRWLRPELPPEHLGFYADALKHGLVKPIPDLGTILRIEEQLPGVTTSEHPTFATAMLGGILGDQESAEGEKMLTQRDSTEIYEELMREVRNEGNTEATE